MSMVRRLLRWLAALALLAGALVTVVYLTHREILGGTDLTLAPGDLSLTPDLPAAVGWSSDGLESAREFARSLETTAVVAIQGGTVVAEWGPTDRRISGHSVRKSIVSVLYGAAVDRGLIDVERTLAELGIDDEPPLTPQEREARVLDLLTARSGIYRSSVKADTESGRPERGAHRPDEAFFYNNWSFNALGKIFEQLTDVSMGDALHDWIAEPIGMDDFRPEDVRWFEGDESLFPAYRIWMSARDLARFGYLILRDGRWDGKQVISEDWVRRSTAMTTDFDDGQGLGSRRGYGYMWWTLGDGRILATGTGGQKLLIDPGWDLVLVNRVDTGEGFSRAVWWSYGPRVINPQLYELADRIMAAAPR